MITPFLLAMASVLAPAADGLPSSTAILKSEIPDWIHFYGNLRVRGESNKKQNAAGVNSTRTRGRLAFRAGAQFRISDDLLSEVRMTTSTGDTYDNYSTWWGVGGGGDSMDGAELSIDRLNLTWVATDTTTLKVGKFGNPFAINPVFGEWTWDCDIQPAGILGEWRSEGVLNMDLRLGHFVEDEVFGASAAPAVTSVQLNLSGGDDLEWGFSTMISDWRDNGFSSTEDFLVWDSVLSASSGGLTGSFEFIKNLDDSSGDEMGIALGFLYGTAGSQGDSRIFGSYFDFEANAFVSEIGQDDTPLPGTGEGMDGLLAGWQYWWRDNISFKIWGLQAGNDISDPMRIRFDIDIELTR